MGAWRKILSIEVTTYKSEGGNQLKGFLANKSLRTGPQYLFDGAKELDVSNNELRANPGHSLALLVYAGLNPNLVKIGASFESVLSEAKVTSKYTLEPNTFFQGTNLVLPRNSALDAQFKSFEHWTSVNEVKHVSIWLLATIRSLYGVQLPSTLEVEIPLPGEARSGRLDVVAKLSDTLLCLEAKTTIADAIKDGRFVEQIPKYRQEIAKTFQDLQHESEDAEVFLVTGGSESDLKCADGVLTVTPIGQRLIDACSQHGIKFVTANAFWQTLAAKLVKEDSSFDLMSALTKMKNSSNFVGLTSAGFVSKNSTVEKWEV
jgi:hypothetical protein